MKNPFRRKTEEQLKANAWGCLSRREQDVVILAGGGGNGLFVSKYSRQASLETLRLPGGIKTVVPNYSARTMQLDELRYEGEIDELKVGADFLRYLKTANVSQKDKKYTFTIDSTGTVAGVSARARDVSEAALSVEGFRARVDASCPVYVETRGRAALRFYLSKYIPQEIEETTVCLAIVEEKGYSTVFWNTVLGLCWETEQPFTESETEDNWATVADELRKLVGPASLQTLKLTSVDHIAVVASSECRRFLRGELDEDRISFEDVIAEEGIDYFVSEGSQSLNGSETEAIVAAGLFITDDRVPAINFNLDLEEDIRRREQARVQALQRQTDAKNRNLTLLLAAPLVTVIICGLVFYASLWMQDRNITSRQEKAKAEETHLSAITKELQDIKKSSDQVQAIGTQIGILKKRQPANFLLLMDLNRKWPAGGAPWQVDEITSKPDGTVTVKGKTTSDESLTEFAKNLDFSEDFEAVKVSKGEGVNKGGAVLTGLNYGSGNGVISFAVEARYLPLAAAAKAPAQTTNAQPGNPPQIANGNPQKQPNS